MAGIDGTVFRGYTSTLNDHRGGEIGRITKQWGGMAREAFTDADTFHIQFSEAESSQDVRLTLIASAFAIDMEFFEKKGSH